MKFIQLILFFATISLSAQTVYKSHKYRTREYNPQFEKYSNWSDWNYTIFGNSKIMLEVFEKGFNLLISGKSRDYDKDLYIKNIEYISVENQFYGDVFILNGKEYGYTYFNITDDLDNYDLFKHDFDKDFSLIFYFYRNDGKNLGFEIVFNGDK